MDSQHSNEKMIHITLKLFSNKKSLIFRENTTVEQAISQLMCPYFIVIYNGEFLSAEEYDKTFLTDGDKIELLTAVAGG